MTHSLDSYGYIVGGVNYDPVSKLKTLLNKLGLKSASAPYAHVWTSRTNLSATWRKPFKSANYKVGYSAGGVPNAKTSGSKSSP